MMKQAVEAFKHYKQNWPNLRIPNLELNTRFYPVPSQANIRRVTGIDDVSEEDFLSSGKYDLTAILNIAEVYGFVTGNVVEWGIGCGRMARHIPIELIDRFAGYDVDPINIKWCNDYLPFGEFVKLDLLGDFNRSSNSVDMLYSFSVMSHIGKEDQIHWLTEINDILKSDGIAIISTHGISSVADASWVDDPEALNDYISSGIKDSGINNEDIADVVPDLYYRDIALTPEFICTNWSKVIKVLDVIAGGFGSTHDAVVCTKL